jgi:hypothetical protein
LCCQQLNVHNDLQEAIIVFNVELVVDLDPMAGNKMKAVLLENKKGIAIVRTTNHAKFLTAQLKEFVKTRRLCAMPPPPTKPLALSAWESRDKRKPGGAGTGPTTPKAPCPNTGPVMPPKPAIVVGTPTPAPADANAVTPTKPTLVGFGANLL